MSTKKYNEKICRNHQCTQFNLENPETHLETRWLQHDVFPQKYDKCTPAKTKWIKETIRFCNHCGNALDDYDLMRQNSKNNIKISEKRVKVSYDTTELFANQKEPCHIDMITQKLLENIEPLNYMGQYIPRLDYMRQKALFDCVRQLCNENYAVIGIDLKRIGSSEDHAGFNRSSKTVNLTWVTSDVTLININTKAVYHIHVPDNVFYSTEIHIYEKGVTQNLQHIEKFNDVITWDDHEEHNTNDVLAKRFKRMIKIIEQKYNNPAPTAAFEGLRLHT